MKEGLIFGISLIALVGCQPARVNPVVGQLPLTAVPARVDLGGVRPLSRHEIAVKVTNPGKSAMTVAQLDSSCECLSLELPKRSWQPSETIAAKIVVDLAKDPDFKGNARLTVVAFGQHGKELFRINCDVSVEPTVPAGNEASSRTISFAQRRLR